MNEIWQTTNQQPWVQAIVDGLITAKTRTTKPCVPEGSVILLHASKSSLWRYWRGLKWVDKLKSPIKEIPRGKVVAVATVKKVGLSERVLKKGEYKYWDVYNYVNEQGNLFYNSVARYAIRFSNVVSLKSPVDAKGFQAPFARAKPQTVVDILDANPSLEDTVYGDILVEYPRLVRKS